MGLIITRIILIIFFALWTEALYAIGQEDKFTSKKETIKIIPTSKEEADNLKDLIATRRAELKENQEYLKKLWDKFNQIKAKYNKEKSEKARSAIALRIVRQVSRVESDKLKIWYLDQLLQASGKGYTSDKDPKFALYLHDSYRGERAKTLKAIDAIFAKMDNEITDKATRHSFEQLKKHHEKEVKDENAK